MPFRVRLRVRLTLPIPLASPREPSRAWREDSHETLPNPHEDHRRHLPGDDSLTEPDDPGWCESAQRIAWRCAATYPGAAILMLSERYDAALDAIVEYVAEHGWPDGPLKPVFTAGTSGIGRASHEYGKHVRHAGYWATGTPGSSDSIGEHITDKLGVHQLTHAFTDGEWAAIWALSEALKWGGGYKDAAIALGISEAATAERLRAARQRARTLWVAPGDTPTGPYRAEPAGRRTKATTWKFNRRYRTREASVAPHP